MQVGKLQKKGTGDTQKIVMAFERLQTSDGSGNYFAVGNIQLAAYGSFIGRGVKEGLNFHTAIDRSELIGAANTGGKGLAGHGIGDTNNGIAAAGGPALQKNPGGIYQF